MRGALGEERATAMVALGEAAMQSANADAGSMSGLAMMSGDETRGMMGEGRSAPRRYRTCA